MTDKYILDGHTPVLEPDLMRWAAWYENSIDERVVAKTEIADGVMVSTVFLSLNHGYGSGPPILFETMVFYGPLDSEMERCSTWAEAEAMHAKMVALVKTPKVTL
jgi:hypothetical protein